MRGMPSPGRGGVSRRGETILRFLGRQPLTGPNDPKALVRREVSILSPLRYPGAKRRLSGYIAEVLRLNGLRPKLFVEPFAGGASVALELLNRDLVDQIALAE